MRIRIALLFLVGTAAAVLLWPAQPPAPPGPQRPAQKRQAEQPDRPTDLPQAIPPPTPPSPQASPDVPGLPGEPAAGGPAGAGGPGGECGLEFEGGLRVCWRRGGQQLRGNRAERQLWNLDLPFPVAEARQTAPPGTLLVSAVDGLNSLRIEAESGRVLRVERLGASEAAAAPSPEVQTLLSQARRTYAAALTCQQTGPAHAAQEEARKLMELSGQLTRLGRATEAFKVWAAAKRIQKGRPPEPQAPQAPPNPPRQPDPPQTVEDLEF